MNTTIAMLLFSVLIRSGLCAAILTKRQADSDDATSTSASEFAAEYMRHYLSTVADENGTPRNLADGPTSLLCFLDYDVVDQQFRERIPTTRKCTSRSTFVFSLESIVGQSMTHQEDIRGRIRAYADIRDHEGINNSVPVNLSSTMNVYSDYASFLARNHTRSNTTVQVTTITDETESGWQFIEITDVLQTIWPITESVIVEFETILEVDCSVHKKIPLKFENPAEVPVEQSARRNRLLRKQPLLVIEIKDRKILEMLEQETHLAEVGEELDSTKSITEEERRKRTVERPACKIDDFTANFTTLGIETILEPRSVNIKRCSGLCDLPTLRHNRDIAPNHAKLMASARAVYDTLNSTAAATHFPVEPLDPCCVPIAYKSIYLLLRMNQAAYDLSLFPNFITERCACR